MRPRSPERVLGPLVALAALGALAGCSTGPLGFRPAMDLRSDRAVSLSEPVIVSAPHERQIDTLQVGSELRVQALNLILEKRSDLDWSDLEVSIRGPGEAPLPCAILGEAWADTVDRTALGTFAAPPGFRDHYGRLEAFGNDSPRGEGATTTDTLVLGLSRILYRDRQLAPDRFARENKLEVTKIRARARRDHPLRVPTEFDAIPLSGLRAAGVDSVEVGGRRIPLRIDSLWSTGPLVSGMVERMWRDAREFRETLHRTETDWEGIQALQRKFLSASATYSEVPVILVTPMVARAHPLRPGVEYLLRLELDDRWAEYPFQVRRANGLASAILGTVFVLGFLWFSTS